MVTTGQVACGHAVLKHHDSPARLSSSRDITIGERLGPSGSLSLASRQPSLSDQRRPRSIAAPFRSRPFGSWAPYWDEQLRRTQGRPTLWRARRGSAREFRKCKQNHAPRQHVAAEA